MFLRVVALCCLVLLNTHAHIVRRDVTTSTPPNILESFQKNLEMFKSCIDKTLANTVDQVNVKQVQPVLAVLGDSLNRFSKAFDDLTASSTTNPEFD